MKYNGSIQKKLAIIIFIVTSITSFIGYSSFLYWYLGNQHQRALELSKTVALVLSQDTAKLIFLDDIAAASDISSKLESFNNLESMVLYKLDKKPVFQYSKDNKTFSVEPLPNKMDEKAIVDGNFLEIYEEVSYQKNKLGYLQLSFRIDTVFDIILKNIKIPITIFFLMMLTSYLLASYFAEKFTRPILKIVSFLEKIEFTDPFRQKIYTTEDNEYGKLYNEANKMIERIKTSQEELKIAAVAFETQTGMMITDSNQKILKVNKAFTNILGYQASEVVGKKPSSFKSGLHGQDYYEYLYATLKINHYWSGEITNKHKDGHIVNEYLTIQTVLDKNGDVLYYVGSFLDLTLQNEIEAKLKENENMLVQQSKMATMGEMLENIAHQWRQPLSVVSTISSGMILTKELGITSTEEEEVAKITKIHDAAQYLSQTIDDFRDFFKPDKQKKSFDIQESYFKTLKLVNSKFHTLGICMVENLIKIEVDGLHNEFMQVMMNILNNARDALETIEGEKYIFIDMAQDNNYAVIQITDNAGGIPEEILNRIFEPYFTTKNDNGGTGIGLYMSYEMMVKHMNGKLLVENKTFEYKEKTHKGASFTLKLPLQ